MRDGFELTEFIEHCRKSWRVPAIIIGVAVLGAALVSQLLPKRYTAQVTMMIDPPAASDLRAATAVSPVYLESLRSFERLAASDSLFSEAVNRFHLQDASGRPAIEALKKRVLRVTKPRDTKILELAITLPDPRQAHEMAAYIAGKAVELNRNDNLESDREAVVQVRKQQESAQKRLDEARKAAADDGGKEDPESLASVIQANADLLSNLRSRLIQLEAFAAEEERDNSTPTRSRLEVLRTRVQELEAKLAGQRALAAKRSSTRDAVRSELEAAREESETSSERLRELEASAGTRGERLRIIDSGIVPQRPSFPNLPLNVVAAAVLATVVSAVYVCIQFARRPRAAERTRWPISRGGASA